MTLNHRHSPLSYPTKKVGNLSTPLEMYYVHKQNIFEDQQMYFAFMYVISLHSGHQDVSTTHEAIFSETRTRQKYNLCMHKSLDILITVQFFVKIHGSIMKQYNGRKHVCDH